MNNANHIILGKTDITVYIATFYRDNYGSVLQAFALQQKLRELGSDAYTLETNPRKVGNLSILDKLRRIKYALKPQKHYNLLQRLKRELQISKFAEKNEKLDRFVTDNIKRKSIPECQELINDNTRFVAGSDQIWSLINSDVIDDRYLFCFTKCEYKYSYAASIGLNDISERQKLYYQEALKSFITISLREDSAVKAISPLFKKGRVRRDIDPTLLHDVTFWNNYCADRLTDQKYIFVYELRPNKNVIRIAKKVAKHKKCKIVYMGQFADKHVGTTTICDAGIEEFLSYIKYAEAVVTNSFHGTVFSIIFHRPFYSVKISSTSARVENILSLTGLSKYYVEKTPVCLDDLDKIDFSKAEEGITSERLNSVEYLQQVIDGRRSCI